MRCIPNGIRCENTSTYFDLWTSILMCMCLMECKKCNVRCTAYANVAAWVLHQ